MTIEDAAEELVINQLDIARQSLDQKDRQIWELQRRVELLEEMLNRAAAQRQGFPVPQPMPAIKPAPRRWAVK